MNGDFRLGAWLVQPNLNTVSRNGTSVRLEPKVMGVLVCLASLPGEPVSKEVILKTVWPDAFVTEDVLTRSISELRRTFQDDARESHIIQTIPKRGYRLVAAVEREHPGGLTSTPSRKREAQISLGGPVRNHRVGIALGLIAAALFIAVLIARPKISHWLSSKADVPHIQSIAILPLKNLSGDPVEQYLADGITEELISNLSRIRALTVTSRTSSATYLDTHKSLSQIARELAVDAVVQGTVIRSDGRVRVAAELIQTVPERHLWAGSFESALQDVVTQQRALARNIAVAVAAQLTPEESQRLARASPVNPQAYNDYLLGEYYMWNRRSPDGRKQAIRYLERAVAEDPSYAPSHAGLAQAYFQLAPVLDNSKPNELFERSRAAAFRSVELDDSLPEAHSILGVIHFVSWDLEAAGREFERALDLQPSDARNLYFHAMFLHAQGHQEQAISEARRAVALDPLNISVQSALGRIYTFAGRYDDAIPELNRALAMDPGNTEVRASLGRAYELKGDYPRAIMELQKSRADPLQSSEVVAYLGYIFAKEGKLAQASACLEDLHRMSRNSSYDVSPVDFAILYAGMGNVEKSLAWLQRGYRQRSQSVLDIASMPELASLHNDPRFQDLLRRVGQPQTEDPPAAVLPKLIKKPPQITATGPTSSPLSPDQQTTSSPVSAQSQPARVETRSESTPLQASLANDPTANGRTANDPTVSPNVNAGTSPVPVQPAHARIESLFQNIQPDVVRTRVTHAVLPTYPENAVQAHVTGTVEIGLAVSPSGDVNSARVLIGHPMLISSALEAIRQWRFQPNQVQGELTWSRMRALVRFRADGTTAVAFAPPLLADSFGDLGTQRDERRDASIPPIVSEKH